MDRTSVIGTDAEENSQLSNGAHHRKRLATVQQARLTNATAKCIDSVPAGMSAAPSVWLTAAAVWPAVLNRERMNRRSHCSRKPITTTKPVCLIRNGVAISIPRRAKISFAWVTPGVNWGERVSSARVRTSAG